jgi:hypothetical protein
MEKGSGVGVGWNSASEAPSCVPKAKIDFASAQGLFSSSRGPTPNSPSELVGACSAMLGEACAVVGGQS